MSDESGYGVRECRGHWHVTHGDEDLALPGDPFASEAEACEAMYVAKDLDALRYAASQSFLAFEASLPGNNLHCPTCGGRTNATDSLAGASVLAVDRSRSSPHAVTPPAVSPEAAPRDPRAKPEAIAARLAEINAAHPESAPPRSDAEERAKQIVDRLRPTLGKEWTDAAILARPEAAPPRCTALWANERRCRYDAGHEGPHGYDHTEPRDMTLNQCDGCRRGLPVVDGIHRGPSPFDMIGCTAARYAEAAPPRATTPEPMTEARLAEIRAYLPRMRRYATYGYYADLLAEVDRLRAPLAGSPSLESGDEDVAEALACIRSDYDWSHTVLSAEFRRLERDAARMRAIEEAAELVSDAWGDIPYNSPAFGNIIRELRAALSPSGEPTTTPTCQHPMRIHNYTKPTGWEEGVCGEPMPCAIHGAPTTETSDNG